MANSVWVDLLGAEVRFVQGNRYRTRILESGREHPETLILTHAGGGHVETYARNVVSLGRDVHVVAMEMLWHGLSDTPPIRDDRIAQESEQVLDVMEAMGIDRAWIVGHGSGGAVLTWLALNRPERLKGLVYEITVGGVKLQTGLPPAPPPTPGGRSFAEQTIDALRSLTKETVHARLLPAVHPRHPERITDEMVDIRHALYSRPSTNEALTRYYSHTATFSAAEEQIAGLQVPVLVIANDSRGEDSLVAPRRLASIIPGARFVVMQDTGNWPHWEAPDEFNATIREFILGKA
jgi:2-hydroxy-6-oxonona-2,4-dienedioate hydrolase